jgi:hypothetical protein
MYKPYKIWVNLNLSVIISAYISEYAAYINI